VAPAGQGAQLVQPVPLAQLAQLVGPVRPSQLVQPVLAEQPARLQPRVHDGSDAQRQAWPVLRERLGLPTALTCEQAVKVWL